MNLNVGNHVIEAMLDTGSEWTLIRQGTAAFMGMLVNTTRNIPPLQGVTGKKLRILGSINTSIRIGGDMLEVRLVVVPDHYLHLPILLGMDVMGRVTLTVDYEG